jgi:hypothetical protein
MATIILSSSLIWYSLPTVILPPSLLFLINKTIKKRSINIYCYSLPIVKLSTSLLLLINKTTANRFYTQLLLISAYCHISLLLLLSAYSHIILQPPIATLCLLSSPSQLLLHSAYCHIILQPPMLLSAYSHIILQHPVATLRILSYYPPASHVTLCLQSYYPPTSCCYSPPTVILSSSLLLSINKTIANGFYRQLLLISASCYIRISLQPPLTYSNHTKVLAASGVLSQGKAARRGVDHPPNLRAEVKERVQLCIYSPNGPSWPILGWIFL